MSISMYTASTRTQPVVVPAKAANDPSSSSRTYPPGIWGKCSHLYDLEANSDDYFKEAILRDYDSWVVASALLATAGAGGLFSFSYTKVEASLVDTIVTHAYVISMLLSSLLALSCLNDFISLKNYFNMVPARYVRDAQQHLWSEEMKSRRYNAPIYQLMHGPYDAKTHSVTSPLHRWFGLAYGSEVYFQSMRSLFVGLVSGIYLSYGWIFCIVPAFLAVIFDAQMRHYNKNIHWGKEEGFQAFVDKVLLKQEVPNDRRREATAVSVSS